MKAERNTAGHRWGRIAAFGLIGITALRGFFCDGAAGFCEAKETDTKKEVVDFVTSYYKAMTPEGIETLADYVAESESLGFQITLISYQTIFEHGGTNWGNIKAVVYPMSDGEHWIVSVSNELVVESFDVAIPGLTVELVGRNQDGELQIETTSDIELDDALMKEMREICLSDEIIDQNNEIAAEYNSVISDYPDVMEWLLETSEACDQAIAEGVQAKDEQEDTGRKKTETKEECYVVKKGDCLWSIAEKQLGDGMLWSSIYEANKTVIGEDPNLIYVGVELKLK